ncbi:MAG: hypothetical protein WBX01_13660 [Nitrososphaeraceae archaeon]
MDSERALRVLQQHVIFRWYHPTSNDHFYTTDANGELAPTVGYRYEGAPF